MSISFTIETLAFLEVLKVQFPCNHLYHRIFLFVSSSPTCHVFLWTFQTSHIRTYSHSKKHPSRVSAKYSTRTRNFIFQRQLIKWKFQLWQWYLLCWLRIYLTCRLTPTAVFLELTRCISASWLCSFSQETFLHMIC